MNTTLAPQTASSASVAGVSFHISLNVSDLERSVAFYRSLLGREPAKCRDDYAKFELDSPPLVLSLEPGAIPAGGSLNHLGFRMADSASLVDVQRRLELAGTSTRREEGVECCYARQTKFWVHDPDGNMWEVYTLDADLDHRGDARLSVVPPALAADEGPAKSIWAHRLGDKFPARLPILDGTVDWVTLQGTFNGRLTRDEQLARLAEVRRILRPGGTVHLHMLTADGPTGDAPIHLPGPAAAVEVVPEEKAVLSLLREAGFVDVSATFRAEHSCFSAADCALRETRIEGIAPPLPGS